MKNLFKMMGIALVACSMFASCGEETTQFTITANANDATMGTVTGGGVYDSAATVTLTATPNEGYTFANWSDGVTENPRTITVTGDATYTANFVAVVTSHADVAYANTTWAATFVGCGTHEGQFITRLYKDQTANDQPSVYMVGGTSVGTYTAAQDNDYVFFYFNYNNELTPYNGTNIPVWQCEEMTETITAIDMNAQTFAYTAVGSVWNAAEYLAGNENPTVNSLSTDVNSPWQTIEFSKGNVMPKKLVRK
ncbi:MAG: hypothetical protein IJK07_04580 [Bacteroidales bacterium]|nr:hypothetical protein [Bacteroidales bacterium]